MNQFNRSKSNSPLFESANFEEYQGSLPVDLQLSGLQQAASYDVQTEFPAHIASQHGFAEDIHPSYPPHDQLHEHPSITTPFSHQYPLYEPSIDYYSNFNSSIQSNQSFESDLIPLNPDSLEMLNVDHKSNSHINTLDADINESASLANDGGDLKEIALKNIHTPIPQMIQQFINDRRNKKGKPKNHSLKETEKQIIALIWLLNNCELNATSVIPRDKVYCHYTRNCSHWNVSVLTQAHFAKCVRLLFPNLSVRRLGIKGRARYHYCGIKLNNEGEEIIYSKPIQVENLLRRWGNYETIDLRYISNLFDKIYESNKIRTKLKYPSIFFYLKLPVEHDLVETLYNLHTIKGNEMIQNVKFMDIDGLFESISAFYSVLTMQLLKLYILQDIKPWIISCDLVTFYQIIKIVCNSLQAHNPSVISELNKLQLLPAVMKQCMKKLPEHFIAFKIKLVEMFLGILNKLLILYQWDISNINTDNLVQQLFNINYKLIIMRLPISSANCEVLIQLLQQLPLQLSNYSFNSFINYLDQWVMKNIKPRLSLIIVKTIIYEIRRQVQNCLKIWLKVEEFIEMYFGFIFECGGLLAFDYDQ